MNHWLLRIGDGSNFINSSNKKIWGVHSKLHKSFLEKIKEKDILWFIKNKSKGKIIAMATFKSYNKRIFGPLVNLSLTNEELGWDDSTTNFISDTEIHYDNLYNLENCNLLTNLKGITSIRKYEKEKINLDLDEEYKNIVKYANITNKF
jgi:hypothetical protein